ncbi:hypothetical protein C8R47DRAFT_117928 [Mycena vitilis]|nr:hypothetical protein C8R47DRAFT_117928 [Mycena vitilis]
MFEPFEDSTDFYPGLIVWCDPTCYEPAGNLPTHATKYDRRKSRELRPCLVISVNHSNRTFQAARLSATTPDDPSKWARIDSPPPITWKLNDAWIWVATPPTIAMIFDHPKVMHRKCPFSARRGCVQVSVTQRTRMHTTAPTPSLLSTSKITTYTAKRTSTDRVAVRVLDIVLKVPTRTTVSVIISHITASLRRRPPAPMQARLRDINSTSKPRHRSTKQRTRTLALPKPPPPRV